MPKKVRVYELARELGIENKTVLELCESLGIAATSHSSSIVEAQADRLRRKADREGISKPPEDEEPAEKAVKEEGPSKVISTKKAPAKKARPKPRFERVTSRQEAGRGTNRVARSSASGTQSCPDAEGDADAVA